MCVLTLARLGAWIMCICCWISRERARTLVRTRFYCVHLPVALSFNDNYLN